MPRTSSKPDPGRSRYHTPALEKGLDILELLADAPDGLTQASIARELDRSVSEIFRMLNCLVERGYVAIQRPGDHYTLTLRLFELARRHAPTQMLVRCALPPMKTVAETVDQSCHLTVAEGGRGLVVAQVDAPGAIGFSVRVGSEMDLCRTASGRVLLAFQDPEERDRVLRQRVLRGHTDDDSGGGLRRRLQRIQDRGFEEMDSLRVRGVHDLSVPVLDAEGDAVAALTMPYIQRLDRSEEDPFIGAREALQDAARRIAEALGVGLELRAAEEDPPA